MPRRPICLDWRHRNVCNVRFTTEQQVMRIILGPLAGFVDNILLTKLLDTLGKT